MGDPWTGTRQKDTGRRAGAPLSWRLPIVVGVAALAIGYRREAPPAPGRAPA